MPIVKQPKVLADIYAQVTRRLKDIPTQIVFPDQTLFRQIDPTRPYSHIPMPAPGGFVSKLDCFKLLIPADGHKDPATPQGQDDARNMNRFSGISHNPTIAPVAALYFAMQQQALMNETMHYQKAVGADALNGKCILKVRVMGSISVADLSPHNPGARRFLDSLGKDTWKLMQDPDDCSVARGIGLAIGNSLHLSGLIAQTVRTSERSPDERGDNLLLFTSPGRPVAGISVEEVIYFNKGQDPQSFPVAFPGVQPRP